jgi:autotransporter-associated beta strand protein
VNSTGELVVHAANGDITLSGGVTTASGLTTTGGTVTLGSSAVNALTGGWTVNGGTLILNRSGNDGLTGGTVNRGGTARFGAGGKINNGALITVNSGGVLDVAGFNDVFGAIAGDGTITSSSGTAGGILLSGTGTPSTFTFPGLITGPINVSAQNNAATITLSGANTYTGGTFLKAGKLIAGTDSPAGSPGAFGSTTGAIVLGSNQLGGTGGVSAATERPTLLIGGSYTVGRAVTVGSVSTTNAYNATIGGSNTSGTSTYTGNITLATTAANYTFNLQAATGGTVEFKTGTWSNTGNKAINIGATGNTGTVKLSNALAGTTGAINVSFGTLALGANNVIPNGSPITIGAATLDATTFGDTVGTLDVTSTATLNLGTGGSLFFADSHEVDWTGGTLGITGNFTSGSSIRFGTTDAGLNSTQLALITVNGNSGPFTLDEFGFLTAPPAGGFSAWITGEFANGTVTNQGPNDDDDNDGISNLVEYAIAGQDPTVPNSTIGSFNGTTLSYTKRLDATGLTYAIEESTDLGISDPWAAVTGTPPVYVNDATTISYTLTPGTPPKNFLRLKVLSN